LASALRAAQTSRKSLIKGHGPPFANPRKNAAKFQLGGLLRIQAHAITGQSFPLHALK